VRKRQKEEEIKKGKKESKREGKRKKQSEFPYGK
jgi:hypothetical protein